MFVFYDVIGELNNLTTKIITLLEFLNFVSEVSRLLYEWSSDCWCIWKSFGVNACLQWRNVFSFHFIGEVFLYSFLRIFRGHLWLCTCALAWSISIRTDRIRALLSLPRLALRAEKFQESLIYMMCRECLGGETGRVCNKLYIPLSTRPPTIRRRPIVWVPQDIAIRRLPPCEFILNYSVSEWH
jgi:hypothetical protein